MTKSLPHRLACVTVLALSLTGCAGLLPSEPLTTADHLRSACEAELSYERYMTQQIELGSLDAADSRRVNELATKADRICNAGSAMAVADPAAALDELNAILIEFRKMKGAGA